jgi:hypothetical protein
MIKTTVQLGQKLLRRKSGDVDEWIEFTVNETYLPLINEFPDDYRNLDGSALQLEVDPWLQTR